MIWLGIDAHVNRDLAFMIEQVGPTYTHADQRHVDGVLVRTRPEVYPEIQDKARESSTSSYTRRRVHDTSVSYPVMRCHPAFPQLALIHERHRER